MTHGSPIEYPRGNVKVDGLLARFLNIAGQDFKPKLGSSTGTGEEQSIAHGLGSAPKLALIYIPSTGEIRGVVSDATYIKVTVDGDLAFSWMVVA